MGYYCTIEHIDLKAPVRIDNLIQKRENNYIDWVCLDDFTIDVDGDRYFKFHEDDLVADLKFLRSLGVRGEIEFSGEQSEWWKYILDEEAVKDFAGYITFEDNPTNIYK